MDKETIYHKLDEAYFGEARHERRVLDLLPLVLRDVKHFIDVGASLGQFTYFANRVMTGKITAIEADPIRADRLRQTAAEWALKTGNEIACIHAAAGDTVGTIQFHTTNSNVSGGLFRHSLDHIPEIDRANVEWQILDIPVVTLDSLPAGQAVGAVKIDVEGAELRVLRGAAKLLARDHPLILLELHDFPDPQGQKHPDEVRAFLRGYGYSEYHLGEKSLFARELRRRHFRLWWKAAVTERASNLSSRALRRASRLVLSIGRRQHPPQNSNPPRARQP